jgi:hemerythrin
MEIVWKSEYELGIRVIDAQHRQLIALINKLLKAHEAAKLNDIIENIFNDLLAYCNYHFSLEESLMQEKFYHDYDNYKKMMRFLKK